MTERFVMRNARNGAVLATLVGRASNPWTRLAGLLPNARVAPDEGLWIGGCSAVHTLGMRATLDLYFLDAADCVVKIAAGAAPGRLAITCRGAKSVVELGAAAGPRDVELGDRLKLEEIAPN